MAVVLHDLVKDTASALTTCGGEATQAGSSRRFAMSPNEMESPTGSSLGVLAGIPSLGRSRLQTWRKAPFSALKTKL